MQTTNTIWVANKSNNDWDVFRMSNAEITITQLQSINAGTEMKIVFSGSHNLNGPSSTAEADYFAIRNAQFSDLNKVFKVKTVLDYKTIIVDFTGSVGLPNIDDESTADSYGDLYKFISVRINSMDDVNSLIHYSQYKDKNEDLELKGCLLYTSPSPRDRG